MNIPVIDTALKIIDKVIPDQVAREQAKLKIMELSQAGELKEIDAAMAVIVAEASGKGITAKWRPYTMMVFVAIIANNYILYPYLSLFWDAAPALAIPDDMWQLLRVGIGGYIGSRGVEKVAEIVAPVFTKK